MRKLYLLLFIFSNFVFSHSGHHANSSSKKWHFQDAETTLTGDLISSENGMVILHLSGDNSIKEIPLEAFPMEDQLIIMKRMALAEKFNNSSKRVVHLKSKHFYFALALFQIFVAVFVTQGGFEPPTLRAEI